MNYEDRRKFFAKGESAHNILQLARRKGLREFTARDIVELVCGSPLYYWYESLASRALLDARNKGTVRCVYRAEARGQHWVTTAYYSLID